ncbi:hypothetical protein ACWEU6_36160 [Streptosporangium sandarakinum]
MSADLRTRALAYLRSGAVTVLRAEAMAAGPHLPEYVHAIVRGFRSDHRVLFEAGRWSCSCREDCAHQHAVRLVTGHPTPIRPTSQQSTTVLRRI